MIGLATLNRFIHDSQNAKEKMIQSKVRRQNLDIKFQTHF